MSKFDIFRNSADNKDVLWLECVEGLDAARQRMHEIALHQPGIYFVLSLRNHLRQLLVAKTDTTSLASGSNMSTVKFIDN